MSDRTTRDDWQRTIERITFRFPFPIELEADPHPHWSRSACRFPLRVTIRVPDIRTGLITGVHLIEDMPLFETSEGERIVMVRAAVMRILQHELDECLLVDGVQFRDPHANEARS